MGSRKKHNPNNLNVAHVGAQCNNYEGDCIKILTKATPAEILAPDVFGWTPLHHAVLHDNPKAVLWLLKQNVDTTARDTKGRTAEDLIEDHLGHLELRTWE